MRRGLLIAALLVSAIAAAPAQASTPVGSVSSNWSGYAVRGTHFTNVVGYWTAPSGTCSGGAHSFSAFWVGLGGYSANSNALEQDGTEADCDAEGQVFYSAWYELVPAGPVTIKHLKITPGDVIKASVTVIGSSVSLKLRDETTGQSFGLKVTMNQPDTTSAEWIAEAPSNCDASGNCQPLPLTNFGTITFTGSDATSSNGHVGTINDPAWRTIELQLQGDGGSHHRHFFGPYSATDANPTSLISTGDGFTVNWTQTVQQTPVSQQPLPGYAAGRLGVG